MKTSSMITILRCHNSTTEQCLHCPVQMDCASILAAEDFCDQIASRLSDLLVNLNKTQEQLARTKAERLAWEEKSTRLVRDLREIVYEHQIVDD